MKCSFARHSRGEFQAQPDILSELLTKQGADTTKPALVRFFCQTPAFNVHLACGLNEEESNEEGDATE